jgi:hypothetical protein
MANQQRTNSVKVSQYLTDPEGRKVAAIVDLKELDRVNRALKVIPSGEAWLYQNDEAIQDVMRGLQDLALDRVSKLDVDSL